MCKYYIGYSTNQEIRRAASSGGIGTALIKYLLSTRQYGTTISFEFNKVLCRYESKIIYDYAEYNNCGSIYQDVPLVSFIKNNLHKIKDGIVLTCMPCQVRPIKRLLDKNHIKHFIISLCCSGQTTIEGTWCYYKLLKIDKNKVNHIQYRGDGWPNGIKIVLDDGRIIHKKNYTYPWTLMHKSLLFRPRRCLYCTIKTTKESDISLADPWLKDYIDNDTIGNSIVIASSKSGQDVLRNMLEKNAIELNEIEEKIYIKSQLGTIEKKAKSYEHRKFNKIISSLGKERSIYKRFMTSSAFLLKAHNHFIKYLYKYL